MSTILQPFLMMTLPFGQPVTPRKIELTGRDHQGIIGFIKPTVGLIKRYAMARSVKENEHLMRRSEILAAAQRLIYTKGYEEMSIQDILNELQISKGAFYHYFDSKAELLQALSEQIMNQAESALNPILTDPDLSAIEKLKGYFSAGAVWKSTQKPYLMAMLRGWYSDENAIVRQKVTAAGLNQISTLLDAVIAQGIAEGSFRIAYPDAAGRVILTMLQGFSDSLALFFLERDPQVINLDKMYRIVVAYNEAIERVLGAPVGSMDLVDPKILEEWIIWTVESLKSQDAAPAPQGSAEAALPAAQDEMASRRLLSMTQERE